MMRIGAFQACPRRSQCQPPDCERSMKHPRGSQCSSHSLSACSSSSSCQRHGHKALSRAPWSRRPRQPAGRTALRRRGSSGCSLRSLWTRPASSISPWASPRNTFRANKSPPAFLYSKPLQILWSVLLMFAKTSNGNDTSWRGYQEVHARFWCKCSSG